MDWRFLNTGYHNGAYNMELDESLAQSLVQGNGPATVRVYGWTPPAISLGWNQRIDEIDTAKARSHSIDVVRRPTGGRAILHSAELTYSVTMVTAGKNILAVYNDISRALVCGLRLLGVEASLEKSQPHFPTLYQSPSSVACFSSSARYEIQIGGKKLAGSAQRRYVGVHGEEVVLQHGSLLLGPDHRQLVDFLRFNRESDRRVLFDEIELRTTDLYTELGRVIPFDEAAEAIRTGFEEAWGIRLNATSLEYNTMGIS